MKDLYLIMEGRNRKMAAEQMTARNVAAIIGDVFTQVMSRAKFKRDVIFKMWPIYGEGQKQTGNDQRKGRALI